MPHDEKTSSESECHRIGSITTGDDDKIHLPTIIKPMCSKLDNVRRKLIFLIRNQIVETYVNATADAQPSSSNWVSSTSSSLHTTIMQNLSG